MQLAQRLRLGEAALTQHSTLEAPKMSTAQQRSTVGASCALWDDVHAIAAFAARAVPKATRQGSRSMRPNNPRA